MVFDVDGVLVAPRSSWDVVHEALGTSNEAKVYAELFWKGLLSYMDWMLADTQLWLNAEPRLDREMLEDILSVAEPLPEAIEASNLLRRKGAEIVLISGGINLVVERVAKSIGARLFVSPRLIFDNRGKLLPGGMPVVEADAKHRWLLRFTAELGVPLNRVAVVGDTRVDAPMMRLSGCGVAVRPADDVVVKAAGGRVARDPLEAAELILNECLGPA